MTQAPSRTKTSCRTCAKHDADDRPTSLKHLPLATPVLRKVRRRDRRQTAGEVHNGGIGLQRLVVVLAIEAAVAGLWEEPPGKLCHRLDATCSTSARNQIPLTTRKR